MKTSPTITKIATALLAAQREMEAVSKSDDNPYFNSKYADINKFLEVMKPALNNHGVLLLQPTGLDNSVETVLVHAESGEFIMTDPLKLVLSKQDMQNVGSCITYARRFSLQSLLGMEAEDDDGETAVGRGKFAEPKKVETKPATPKVTVPNSVTATPGGQLMNKPAEPAKVEPPKPVEPPKAAAPAPEKPKSSFKKPSAAKAPAWK